MRLEFWIQSDTAPTSRKAMGGRWWRTEKQDSQMNIDQCLNPGSAQAVPRERPRQLRPPGAEEPLPQ